MMVQLKSSIIFLNTSISFGIIDFTALSLQVHIYCALDVIEKLVLECFLPKKTKQTYQLDQSHLLL